MTTRTRRRYEGPLSIDPRITRLLRVHLRLPRVLVEDIVRAQCYVEMRRYSDGGRHEIPYVDGKAHGTVRWWRGDGSRESEWSYVNGKRHGTATWWRADGAVYRVEEWVHGEEKWCVRRPPTAKPR